ncbi:hypothetical protein EDB84DRAFT_1513898 [Lactarius hengduanensis]|nr:hypothetical protein EDB84DRAFT_1513898 [Lactarius hengduanensis]
MVPYKHIVSLIIARGNGGYPPPYAPPVPRTQCSGAHSKCCNEYTSSQNPSMVGLAESLGLVLNSAVGVATGCSALGSTCNNQAVCCTNTQNGVINIGCSPISL